MENQDRPIEPLPLTFSQWLKQLVCLYQFSTSPSTSLALHPLPLSLLQFLSSMISCLYSAATTVTPFDLLSALLGLQKEKVHTSLAALLKLDEQSDLFLCLIQSFFFILFHISYLWEIPGGGILWQKEGKSSGRWERCGSAFPCTGLCRAPVHLPLRHTSEAKRLSLTFLTYPEANLAIVSKILQWKCWWAFLVEAVSEIVWLKNFILKEKEFLNHNY